MSLRNTEMSRLEEINRKITDGKYTLSQAEAATLSGAISEERKTVDFLSNSPSDLKDLSTLTNKRSLRKEQELPSSAISFNVEPLPSYEENNLFDHLFRIENSDNQSKLNHLWSGTPGEPPGKFNRLRGTQMLGVKQNMRLAGKHGSELVEACHNEMVEQVSDQMLTPIELAACGKQIQAMYMGLFSEKFSETQIKKFKDICEKDGEEGSKVEEVYDRASKSKDDPSIHSGMLASLSFSIKAYNKGLTSLQRQGRTINLLGSRDKKNPYSEHDAEHTVLEKLITGSKPIEEPKELKEAIHKSFTPTPGVSWLAKTNDKGEVKLMQVVNPTAKQTMGRILDDAKDLRTPEERGAFIAFSMLRSIIDSAINKPYKESISGIEASRLSAAQQSKINRIDSPSNLKEVRFDKFPSLPDDSHGDSDRDKDKVI